MGTVKLFESMSKKECKWKNQKCLIRKPCQENSSDIHKNHETSLFKYSIFPYLHSQLWQIYSPWNIYARSIEVIRVHVQSWPGQILLGGLKI